MGEEMMAKDISRRHFIKIAGACAFAGGMGVNIIMPDSACAKKKKLKILHWTHTDSEFNWWFQKYCQKWGQENETKVELKRMPE